MSTGKKKGWEKTADLLRSQCRLPSARNIGLEIERIGNWPDGRSLQYRLGNNPLGAEQFLVQLAKRLGWEIATYSEAFPLGLSGPTGKVSLEPGSQLEFAAAPQPTVGETFKTLDAFENHVDALSKPLGLHWIGLGVNPIATVEDIDVIPLTRYRIMTDYLSQHGSLGTTMMRLTSSIQINFDYSSENEAIEMLRTALAVAPLSCALFGNSPLSAGKPNGWLSFRSEVWRNTDPHRTGLMPEAFQDDFDFDTYCRLAWKRPLMFVANRDGKNVESLGHSLEDIQQGQLENCELNEENELNSLRQLFTEARIKPGYIEVRSIDGLRTVDRYAAVAFWTGLMYGPDARLQALDCLGTLSDKLRNELWVAAGREGLRAKVGGLHLETLASELLAASRDSLLKRGRGEEKFLVPLEKNVAQGKNPANLLLENFLGPWKKDITKAILYSADRSI